MIFRFVRRLLTIAVLAAMALVAYYFAPKPEADKAVVIRVIDGDTLKVTYMGRPESVRLIGMDTPESRDNEKARRDSARRRLRLRAILSMGERAKRFVQNQIKPGEDIKLEFDVQQRDKYGRLLAYVYLPDGHMLNEIVVRAGYAALLTVPPNVKYQERLLAVYRQARQEKIGLWK